MALFIVRPLAAIAGRWYEFALDIRRRVRALPRQVRRFDYAAWARHRLERLKRWRALQASLTLPQRALCELHRLPPPASRLGYQLLTSRALGRTLILLALMAAVYWPASLPVLIGTTFIAPPPSGVTLDPFLDITVLGADKSGVVDATGIVNTAITRQTTAGGIVFAGPGSFSISTLLMKANVYLCGAGRATVFVGNSAGDMINLATVAEANTELGHFRLNGNASTAAFGVQYTNTAPLTSGFSTARHKIHDVFVNNCAQDGIKLNDTGDASGGGSEISHVQVYAVDGTGITLNVADSLVDNCDIGQSGVRGLRDIGGTNKISGTKCWLSGRLDSTNGDGFWIKSATAITSCVAQDSKAHGFNFFGANAAAGFGLVADSNGRGTINTLGYSFGSATQCNVQGSAFDRQGSPTQTYAVGGLASATKCVVIVSAGAHLTGLVASADLVADNTLILTKSGGPGVSKIGQAPAVSTGNVAAVASIVAATSPNDGAKHVYRVSGFVCITTLGSGNINLQVTYTDTNGSARTCNIPLCAQAGTFAASATTADDYKGSVEISVNPNTAITLLTAGTFAGCTYNTGGTIVPLK